MRRVEHQHSKQVRPLHWIGFAIVVGFFGMVLLDGAVGAAFGLVGTILIGTAIYHTVRKTSWLLVLNTWLKGSPAVSGFLIGGLFFGVGMAIDPAEDSVAAEPAPKPADDVVAVVDQKPKPSLTPTPSPEPSASPSASVSPTPTASPSPIVRPTPEPTPEPTVTELAALPDPSPSATEATAPAGLHPALAILAELEVKGRAPKTGYDRDEFGQRWLDVDRNGCDTRNDILGRDLTDKTFKSGTRDCVVLTGVLADPFTGTSIDFVRGNGTSNLVQIDHVVALADAWQKGAQQLSFDTRAAFANDPLNLLAVDGASNLQKGDGDAATWLPPNKSFRCEYVAIQVAVKHKYSLWVTKAEAEAITRVLSDCPSQQAAGDGEVVATSQASPTPTPTVAAEPARPAPLKAATAQPSQAPMTERPAAIADVPAAPPKNVYYKNCDAVRVAGAAPILRGEPGYRKGLDRDGDGIGCE